MNCEDAPMSEWDKLTGAEEEALDEQVRVLLSSADMKIGVPIA